MEGPGFHSLIKMYFDSIYHSFAFCKAALQYKQYIVHVVEKYGEKINNEKQGIIK